MTTPTAHLHSRRHAALAVCALLLVPLAGACSSGGRADEAVPATTATEESGGDVTTTTNGDDQDPGPTTIPDLTTTTETTTTGGNEPAGDARAYDDALIAALAAEGNTDLPMDEDQAECIAPRWIDAIGPGRFSDRGIGPDDLDNPTGDGYFDLIDGISDAETAEQLVGAFAECDIDLTELVAGFIDDRVAPSPDQIACFVDAVPDGAVERSLTAALDGDDRTIAPSPNPTTRFRGPSIPASTERSAGADRPRRIARSGVPVSTR